MFGPEEVYSESGEIRVECPGYAPEFSDETSEEELCAPDFVHAAVRYGDTALYGAVRVDSRSSDWRDSGRMTDPAFDNVMFHVVGDRDRVLVRAGHEVRTLVLRPEAAIEQHYAQLLREAKNGGSNSCVAFFGELESVEQGQILSRLVADRLRRKVAETKAIHRSVGRDWNETAYICYLRSLGMGDRKRSYEALARSVPLRCFVRCAGDAQQAEALLLGQSGYLTVASADDPAIRQLQDIYLTLKKEYDLRRPVVSWSGMGVRPTSLPPSMLQQAAALLVRTPLPAERVREAAQGGMTALRRLFGGTGETGVSPEKTDLRIINFVIPLLTAMGRETNDAELQEQALTLYEEVAPEKNRYTRLWATALDLRSASDSQAVIQLCTEYCAKERCADCPIGILQMVRLHKKLRASK
ncbi:MAG: DUF2851 family protein [Rikenella sp.]|nr:DUF2851 family protein [Rikenella sp.]